MVEPGDVVLVKGSRAVGLEVVSGAPGGDRGVSEPDERRPWSSPSVVDRGQILIAGIAAMLITIFLGPNFIEFLRDREFGQQIREEGPQEHHAKAGTPTMGGIILFLAISVPYLVLGPRDKQSLAVFGVAIGCAALGFADDWIKIRKRRSLGLSARWKLLVQIGLAQPQRAGIAHEDRRRERVEPQEARPRRPPGRRTAAPAPPARW